MELEGQPWIVAKDACLVLGLTNQSQHTAHLCASEKGLISTDTLGGKQKLMSLSEASLLKLIMRSNTPVAKQFQDWVTKTVLPVIRNYGGYISGEEKVNSRDMTEDELILKAVGFLQAKVERLSAAEDTA